ncbi:MAG: lipase family protein, partial [Candidatus Wallbacteria bacterium]|nr:lipase family protein [Candidatus Wallbacteria bacterium]
TEPTNFHDWGTDARARLVQNPLGLVHTGFIGSLADIWNDLLQVLAGTDKADAATGRPAKPLWLAGHSLGGAVAELAADRLTAEKLGDVRFLYTYGKPAAGDGGYSAQLAARLQDKLYRIVNNDDLVPRLPPAELGYSHAGRLCYLDSRGKLSFNPDQAFLTKAGLLGMIDNLGKLVPVAVRDHFLAGYLDALKALCGQP